MSTITPNIDYEGNNINDNINKSCVLCQITGENLLAENEILQIMRYKDNTYTSFIGYICKEHDRLYSYDKSTDEWVLKNPSFEKKHREKINEIIDSINNSKFDKFFKDVKKIK